MCTERAASFVFGRFLSCDLFLQRGIDHKGHKFHEGSVWFMLSLIDA